MRKGLLIVTLFAVVVSGCSSQIMATVVKEFPLKKGTTWVYSYQAYEPSVTDPTQIIRATYRLTETVADTQFASPYLVAHIQSTWDLIHADVGWTEDFISNRPNETWYVVKGQQVFGSGQAIDIKNIDTDNLLLDYDFPLTMNKNWCPMQSDSKDPSHKLYVSCQYSGERQITDRGAFESPAGKFNDCYNMVDYFNDGNIFQKFCNGIGVVSIKFDHNGTRFGFEQTLTYYSAGVP